MCDRNIVKLRNSNNKYTKLSKYTNNNVVGDVTRRVAANGLGLGAGAVGRGGGGAYDNDQRFR